jgi:hypothetical protein
VGRKKPARKRGTAPRKDSRWGLRGKTFWDWLPVVGAFLIPVVIAAATWLITWQQARLEDRRAERERALEEQRAQDVALQAYLDQMSQLMLDTDLMDPPDSSTQINPSRTLARARTINVLPGLDTRAHRALGGGGRAAGESRCQGGEGG